VPLAVSLRPLLVGVLFVLAGCGGLAGNPSPAGDGTITPAPVPTDPPTSRPERAEPPDPLVGETPDPSRLDRYHARGLERRSYRLLTYVGRSERTGRGGPVRSTIDRRIYRVQRGWTYRAVRVSVRTGSGTTERFVQWEAYADGDAEYRRTVAANGTSYERRPFASGTLPPHRERTAAVLGRYLDVGDVTVEIVRTDRGSRIRVVGREPRAPGFGNVTDYRVEAVLTEDGLVERFEATYLATNGSSVLVGFQVDGVDSVRVEPPSWYEEAREATLGGGSGARGPSPDGNATATSRPHPAGQ
jgi:hypothetical protein